jgi:hypothetical protein
MMRSLNLLATACASATLLASCAAGRQCPEARSAAATPSAPAPAEPPAVSPAPTPTPEPASATSAPPAKELPRAEPDQNTGVVDPAPINAALAQACGEWTFDQILQHLTGTGVDRMKLEIEVYQGGQRAIGGAAADEARVLVERHDLLDDSIQSERHHVTLRKRTKADADAQQCDGWFVEQARVEWKCVRGSERGRWIKHWCP